MRRLRGTTSRNEQIFRQSAEGPDLSIVALTISTVSFLASTFSALHLERWKAGLATTRDEEAARRDYTYEARKRLYAEVGPLLFQAREACENFVKRVESLARISAQGNLEPGHSWLQDLKGYYALTTYYRLFVPLAIFRLLQRKLALVDLGLDPHIDATYRILKELFFAFANDFRLAEADHVVKKGQRMGPVSSASHWYQPNVTDWREARARDPRAHWRQGLPFGHLDQIADALIVDKEGPRIMTFGEFQAVRRVRVH